MVAPWVHLTSSAKILQLRLGVDDGVVGEEEVRLVCLALFFGRLWRTKIFAVGNAVGLVGQDAVIVLRGFRMEAGRDPHGVMTINCPPAPPEIQPVQNAFRAFAVQKQC